MKQPKYKDWCKLHEGEKLSRKAKKLLLGVRPTRKELKKRLANVVITHRPYPLGAFISDRFCPKCGCDISRTTGNMVEYPESWVRDYCARCGFLVGEQDNGPYVHCLELKEYNYDLRP